MFRVTRAEAGAWSKEGQQNVVYVILNRMNSAKFPNTLAEVIFQKGQFAVVSNGSWNRVEISEELRENVIEAYLNYSEENNAQGALYFGAGIKTGGSQYLFTDEVGHVFYK